MTIYSRIVSTGGYLPEKILTNDDLAKMVDTSDEWITQRSGIRQRHIIGESGDTTCHMAEQAARKAIERADIDVNELDYIVVGTATPDYSFPSVACILQKRLGIKNECTAFDVNAACSGFVYGLSLANQSIRLGESKKALVVGADTLTIALDWTDRSTCVLFGDGAGAVVVEASEEPGILKTHLHANGAYTDLLFAKNPLWHPGVPAKIEMDGRETFKFAVTKLGEAVEEVLASAGIDKSEVDWLVPHQANLRIIQAVAKRLELPMERVVVTVDRHANTSAASIPLALNEAVQSGCIKRGELLLLEAFGGGLSWGSALIRY